MRWKRTSQKKTAEIVACKVDNPDMSLRDIEKKTWINKQTVSKLLKKEIPELTKLDKTNELINLNLKIISKWKKKILKSIDSIKINSMNEVRSLSLAIDDAFKQNQLLNWWATENNEIKIIISKE